MEIIAGPRRTDESAVKAHDMVPLILHPNAAAETALPRLGRWSDVENQAAYFTQEFAADVIEIVICAIQTGLVDVDHLQEAARQELHRHREKAAQRAHAVLTAIVCERLEFDALG